MNKRRRISDVAAQIGVDPGTVRRWLNRGDGPPHTKTPGGVVIFHDTDALEKWLASLRSDDPTPDQA